MPHRFSRAELYRLVWASPVTTIAKQLGVSDTAVGKVCRAANVPLPPRGYWAKKAAGKGVEPTPLPAREIGQSDEVHFGDQYGYNAAPLAGSDPDEPSPPVPVFEEPIELVKARIQKTIGRVRLIRSMDHPHARISSSLKDEDERRQKAQKQAYLLPSEEPRLQTPGSQRKLRLLNSLFVTWSDAGWHPGGFDPDTGNFSLRVGDQVVPLRIQEFPVRSKGPSRGRPAPPGLRLQIRAWRDGDSVLTWQDSEERKVEDNLSEVATMVVLRGEELHRQDTAPIQLGSGAARPNNDAAPGGAGEGRSSDSRSGSAT